MLHAVAEHRQRQAGRKVHQHLRVDRVAGDHDLLFYPQQADRAGSMPGNFNHFHRDAAQVKDMSFGNNDRFFGGVHPAPILRFIHTDIRHIELVVAAGMVAVHVGIDQHHGQVGDLGDLGFVIRVAKGGVDQECFFTAHQQPGQYMPFI